jgi:hypothetical protein
MALLNRSLTPVGSLQTASVEVAALSPAAVMTLACLLVHGTVPSDAVPLIGLLAVGGGVAGYFVADRVKESRKIAAHLILVQLCLLGLHSTLCWTIASAGAAAVLDASLLEASAGILLGALVTEDVLFWLKESEDH